MVNEGMAERRLGINLAVAMPAPSGEELSRQGAGRRADSDQLATGTAGLTAVVSGFKSSVPQRTDMR